MKYVIVIICALSPVFPLSAQEAQPDTSSATPAPEKPYRNPRRALILGSIIPGAGHIYAGEYVKGILTYEGTVASIGMGVLTYMVDECTFALFQECESGPAWPHQVVGVGMVGLGLWMWASSARDARRAAERANERHRRRFEAVSPIIKPFSGPSNAPQVGLSILW